MYTAPNSLDLKFALKKRIFKHVLFAKSLLYSHTNLVRRSLSAQGNFFILNGVAIAIAATGSASGGGGGGRKYNNVMHAFSMEEKKRSIAFYVKRHHHYHQARVACTHKTCML